MVVVAQIVKELKDLGYGEEELVEAGFSKRMLFGTDLPWFSPLHGIGAVMSADISDDDRHNILHRNAEELLSSFE